MTSIKSWQVRFRARSVYSLRSCLPLRAVKAHLWLCPIDSAFSFSRIFINLAGNQDSHKILDEFEFWPDRTIHFGVTCPWVAKKPIFDLVRSIVPSILIGSSSNLQVTGVAINSRMSSNFGGIRLFTSELLALENRKKPIVDLVRSMATSFFIGCSSNLQATRTAMKSLKSSISGQIGLFSLALLALERWKIFPCIYNGDTVVQAIAT